MKRWLLIALIPWGYIHADHIGSMRVGEHGYISSNDMVVDYTRHAWLRSAAPVHDQLAVVDDTKTNMVVTRTAKGYTVQLDCDEDVKWAMQRRPAKGFIPVVRFSVRVCTPPYVP